MRIPYKKAISQKGKPGKPFIGKKPEKAELKQLYIKEVKSIREIAEILGCSKDRVYRTLQEFGIERRSKIRRSQLEKYDLIELRSRAREKGFRGLARELGINHGTLLHYFKTHHK